SIGLAGGAVVLGGVSAALTLTPAALAILANRIGAARTPPDDGFFARLARRTRRRALPIALVVAFLLAALATPFAGIRLVNSEAAQILTPASEPRRHAELVRDRFP